MSTEHQRYSTTNQRIAIEHYAKSHDMEVVQTFEDAGRSGLTLWGRPGLQELLDAVVNPRRSFSAVLVFDVSRWGRFQDVDESAYYEFACRRAGVDVLYCAEPFGDIPGPMAVVVKSVKRAMAAEYSRELSAKVYAGQSLLARKGFHMGGRAGYALKRVLVDESGDVKFDLKDYQRKSLQTDRVLLAIGNKVDAGLVRLIFHLCARSGLSEADIARQLNWSCYPGKSGLHPWRAESVRKVLTDEKYAGTIVYGRRCTDIRSVHRAYRQKSKWVRSPGAFEPIVSKEIFDAAQLTMTGHHRHYWTDEEMLDVLRRVYAEHGAITAGLLRRTDPRAPGTVLYINHFGSMAEACEAAGIEPSQNLQRRKFILHNRHNAKIHLLRRLEDLYRRVGIDFIWVRNSRRALVEGGLTISVRTTQPWLSARHRSVPTWFFGPDQRVCPDYSLVGRLDASGETFLDYVLFPESDGRMVYVRATGSSNPEWVKKYRCESLEEVFRRLEVVRLTLPPKPFCAVGINLAKRRRKVLHIRKRVEMPRVVDYAEAPRASP